MKKIIWTEEKIKIGFERFFQEYGRLPRSHEIDRSPFLPSNIHLLSYHKFISLIKDMAAYKNPIVT